MFSVIQCGTSEYILGDAGLPTHEDIESTFIKEENDDEELSDSKVILKSCDPLISLGPEDPKCILKELVPTSQSKNLNGKPFEQSSIIKEIKLEKNEVESDVLDVDNVELSNQEVHKLYADKESQELLDFVIAADVRNFTDSKKNAQQSREVHRKKSKILINLNVQNVNSVTDIIDKREYNENNKHLIGYLKVQSKAITNNKESVKINRTNEKELNKRNYNQSRDISQVTLSNIDSSKKKKNFTCQLCGKSYAGSYKLKMHTSSKCNTIKQFGCDICAKGFFRLRELNAHKKTAHSPNDEGKYKCDECDKNFSSKLCVKEHKKRIHIKSPKLRVECQYCNKTYAADYLRWHVMTIHKVNVKGHKEYECAYCGKKMYNDKNQFILHIKRHMKLQTQGISKNNSEAKTSSVKKCLCDTCGKSFKSKDVLENHNRIHTGEKPFSCEKCGKCFRTISNLFQHTAVHSDERRFKCDICDKAFRIRNHLRQHMAVHGMVNSATTNRRRKTKRT